MLDATSLERELLINGKWVKSVSGSQHARRHDHSSFDCRRQTWLLRNRCVITSNRFVLPAGKTFKTIDPKTERVIAEVCEADKPDVDKAVAAARYALLSCGPPLGHESCGRSEVQKWVFHRPGLHFHRGASRRGSSDEI